MFKIIDLIIEVYDVCKWVVDVMGELMIFDGIMFVV